MWRAACPRLSGTRVRQGGQMRGVRCDNTSPQNHRLPSDEMRPAQKTRVLEITSIRAADSFYTAYDAFYLKNGARSPSSVCPLRTHRRLKEYFSNLSSFMLAFSRLQCFPKEPVVVAPRPCTMLLAVRNIIVNTVLKKSLGGRDCVT